MSKLTDKQKTFCEEYLIDLNATQAAIRAGYSEKTAKEIGCENLTKPNIQEYIQELQGKRSERTEVTADIVVKELLNIALADTRDFFCDITGELLPPNELDDRAAKSASGFKITKIKSKDKKSPEETIEEYKRYDKIKALELLGRHLSMFTDKVDVKGEFDLSSFVKAIHGEKK